MSCRQCSGRVGSTKRPWLGLELDREHLADIALGEQRLIVRVDLERVRRGHELGDELGAFREASSMRRPSAAFMAMRASHSTCLPAPSAAMVISQCM